MEMIRKLTDYGVDMNTTLDRFLDDKEFYIECIEAFLEETTFDDLENAIEEKDYTQAFAHAHNLKGVLSNLGLKPILEPTSILVEKLRDQEYDDVASDLSKILNERDKFLSLVE